MEWYFIGLAALPLAFCPTRAFNGFAVPQTLALGLLSAVGLMLGVWNGLVPTTLPGILSMLFALYMGMSLMWMYPVHNAKKEFGQQLPAQLAFLLGCVYLTWDNFRWVALAFCAMLALQALYGHLQTQLIDPFFPPKIKAGGPKDNPIGSIGNPNFLAGYVCSTVWLAVYAAAAFATGANYRALWLVPLGGLYLLWRTGCRAGQLAMVGSVVFFVAAAAGYGRLPLSAGGNDFLFTMIAAYGVFLSVFLYVVLKTNWETFWRKPIDPKGKQVWYASLRYRLCFWVTALYLIRERPVFGWGMWSYRREVYRMQAWLHHNRWNDFLRFDRYLTPQPREVHNDFIEQVVEFGAVGGALWFALVGTVYWTGFSFLGSVAGAREFFLMLILLTSVTCTLLDGVFFFVLRLPSSSVAFWVSAAGVVALGGGQVAALGQSLPLALAALALWAPFVYYCAFTRFMASWCFSAARNSPSASARGRYLEKAINWQPHDTLLRTFAALSIVDFDSTSSNLHCQKMLDDFDGMAPQHATFFNAALCRVRTRNHFEEPTVLLNYGHWLHPYWPPIKDLLFSRDGVGIRSKYVGGERTLVKGNEETLWKVKALMKTRENLQLKIREVEGVKYKVASRKDPKSRVNRLEFALLCKEQELFGRDLQACYLSLKTVIITEKKRLNVPDNWFYDKERGEFLAPVEVENVQAKNLLLPDCMDAAPAELPAEQKTLMDQYMFGKEAYQPMAQQNKEQRSETWGEAVAPPLEHAGKEGRTDGDDAVGAVQGRESPM